MNNRMELSFSAIAENEAFARMVISAFLMQNNPKLSVISEIRTAVSEAVTNVVVHAYCDDKKKEASIVMRALLENGQIHIEIQDFGSGIDDIQQAMTPFYTSKPEQERTGMGFSLMLSFMDKVEVHSEIGHGTLVKMSKYLGNDDMDAI